MLTATHEIEKLFSGVLEAAVIRELEEKSMLMNARVGQTLLMVGQPIKMVPVVLQGTIKVSRLNEEGYELLLYYVRAGHGCGITFSCGMMAQPSLVQGTAEEDVSILCVPVNVMEEWMGKYASWKRFVMSTIVNEFMDVIKSVDDLSFKKLDIRLIEYLKLKSTISGSSLVNVTHQQIGDELRTNRVVVSRLLKKLESEGKVILYRHQIKLLKHL